MYVKEFMHTNVITACGKTPLVEAQGIMEKHHVRRLPITHKEKLVGIVTLDRMTETIKHPGVYIDEWDFAAALTKIKVEDVMERNVVTVTPDTSIEDAVTMGQKHRVGTLPVLEGEKLVGIITTTDLYEVTTQILGFGEPGVRLHISHPNNKSTGDITSVIGAKGVRILSLLHITPPGIAREDCIVHLDTDDATAIIDALEKKGYSVEARSSSVAYPKGLFNLMKNLRIDSTKR
ncbi:MAG: CBS domain-containing protein [Chloroflexota bacterium]|nr:CBS domain-containing protein [Chloroflexota bacterium]